MYQVRKELSVRTVRWRLLEKVSVIRSLGRLTWKEMEFRGALQSAGEVLQLRAARLRCPGWGRPSPAAQRCFQSGTPALPPCGVPARLRVDVAVESFECECEAVCPSFASQEFSFKKQSCSYEVAYWSQNLWKGGGGGAGTHLYNNNQPL